MPLANYELGDALLTVLEIFLFVAWFWIFVIIIGDLFRDHETSGWGKALWVLVLIVMPFLGSLIYLIARGGSMHERAEKQQELAKRQFDDYVRDAAGSSSPVDELAKLSDLKEKGAISEDEYARLKGNIVDKHGATA